MSPSLRPHHPVRRVASVTALLGAVLTAGLALAGPAAADPPEGWEVAPDVDSGFLLGVMIGGPVLLFVIILAFVYVPPLVRGERVAPGAPPLEDQWLGGRRSAGELSAPSPAGARAGAGGPAEIESSTGGAGGRW